MPSVDEALELTRTTLCFPDEGTGTDANASTTCGIRWGMDDTQAAWRTARAALGDTGGCRPCTAPQSQALPTQSGRRDRRVCGCGPEGV